MRYIANYFGDNFDSVLLYGALREGYLFIKAGPEQMATIDAKYTEAVALAKRLRRTVGVL